MLQEENTPRTWAMAVGILILAGIFRWLLWDVVPGRPYFVFYSAVIAASFLCGWREATAMIVLTTALALFLAKETHAVITTQPSVLYTVTMTYVMTTGFAAWAIHNLRDRLRDSLRRNTTLTVVNGEMSHRIRNVLTIAGVVGAKTIHAGLPPEQTANALHGRLIALSQVYDTFVAHSVGSRMDQLIDKVVCPLSPDASRIVINGEGNPRIPYQQATTFALVLHELATNALKHGAWSVPNGRVTVGFVEDEAKKHLWFEWCERCGDGCSIPGDIQEGVGMKLIKRSMGDAHVQHRVYADGVRCSIEMDLQETP